MQRGSRPVTAPVISPSSASGSPRSSISRFITGSARGQSPRIIRR
jgi:hypothetical protein